MYKLYYVRRGTEPEWDEWADGIIIAKDIEEAHDIILMYFGNIKKEKYEIHEITQDFMKNHLANPIDSWMNRYKCNNILMFEYNTP